MRKESSSFQLMLTVSAYVLWLQRLELLVILCPAPQFWFSISISYRNSYCVNANIPITRSVESGQLIPEETRFHALYKMAFFSHTIPSFPWSEILKNMGMFLLGKCKIHKRRHRL